VFPTDLMLVRRKKDGHVFPVFLTKDHMQYCTDVNSVFQSCVGKRSGDIDREIKDLESRAENHKIVRALATIVLRKSLFVPPSRIPATEIRDYLFTKAKFPAYRPEERDAILREAASHFGVTTEEIIAGMYGDKDTEQVMETCYTIPDEELAREFNMEMLETVLSKSTSLVVRNISDWQELSTRARLSGVAPKPILEGGKVRGMLINTQTSRHARGSGSSSTISDIIRFVLSRPTWVIEAQVSIENKTWGRKDQLMLTLNESASYYLQEKIVAPAIEIPPWLALSRTTLNLGETVYMPCFEANISGKPIYIFISGDTSEADDIEMSGRLETAGIDFVVASLNASTRQQRKGWYHFKGSINWDQLKESITGTEKRKKMVSATAKSVKLEDEIDDSTIKELKVNIDRLYPDSVKIIDYIESRGLVAGRVLNALGYKVKWKGLDMIVSR